MSAEIGHAMSGMERTTTGSEGAAGGDARARMPLWRRIFYALSDAPAFSPAASPCETHRITALEERVAALEARLITYYRERWDCIDKLADYLVGAELPGDYLEFGVYNGMTFSYAMKVMARLFPSMRFVALDSFEGLPKPRGVDAQEGFTSSFRDGQFACSEGEFLEILRSKNLDLDRVLTVKGWFDQSLAPDSPATAAIGKVAAAWIDCDLYESTLPVLDFLSDRLSVGSVLLFDDWRCFRNLADFGEQRACREWLARNPQIKLNDFVSFGFHGRAFTVAAC
jgi:O-methyltransferase